MESYLKGDEGIEGRHGQIVWDEGPGEFEGFAVPHESGPRPHDAQVEQRRQQRRPRRVHQQPAPRPFVCSRKPKLLALVYNIK